MAAARRLPLRIARSLLFDLVVPWALSAVATVVVMVGCILVGSLFSRGGGFAASWLSLVIGWALAWALFLVVLSQRRSLALQREARDDSARAPDGRGDAQDPVPPAGPGDAQDPVPPAGPGDGP